MRTAKRIISLLMTAAMLASLLAMTGFQANAASATGRQVRDFGLYFTDNKFKILQLADIQTPAGGSGNNMSAKTKQTVRLAIERYEPDLIIFTGDQTQGSATTLNWKRSADALLATVTDAGFPLSRVMITTGNHDTESISTETQQSYYVEKGCIDFDNNFSNINLAGGGTGCVPIKASQSDSSIAFNVVLFDSQAGGYRGGYSRVGGTNGYNDIVSWYTSMNNALGNYSYKRTKGAVGNDALVPTLCGQHIILQEIYMTGGLVPCTSGGVSNYGSFTHPQGYNRFKTNDDSAGLHESPCCTAGDGTDTAAQYNAIVNPGNCIGFTFGHDHDNYFDVTDDNGLRFLAASGLSQETYLTDGDPGVRFFELTLDPDTGDVRMDSENRKYSQMLIEETELETERMAFVDGNGNQLVNTISSPKTIYVGAAGNNMSTQEFGNIIQDKLIDYGSKALYSQDRAVRVVVPSTATGGSFTAICNGVNISSEAQSYSVENGICTEYTLKCVAATADQPIIYTYSYDLDGVRRTIYGSSMVENIKMPGGYATFTRGYATSTSGDTLSHQHIGLVHGANVFSSRQGASISDGALQINGMYYNYGYAGNIDESGGYRSKTGDSRYSIWLRSPTRERDTSGVVLIGNYMQVTAGSAPKSVIYIDKGEKKYVSPTDRRLLTGASLTYWIGNGLDSGYPEYIAGLGFRNGNLGFKADDYRQYFIDEMATVPGGYSSNPDGDSTGNWAYDDYAANQSLNGIGSTHINGNTLEANRIGASRGDRLTVELTSAAQDTWATEDSSMTMYVGIRSKRNSQGYALSLNEVEPYYLEFKYYDKTQLRSLVTAELTEPRNQSDFENADSGEWNNYVNALTNALSQLLKIDTTQAVIDTARTDLENAVGVLLNAGVGRDNTEVENWGESKASAVSVPHVLYVKGNTIQTAQPFTARSVSIAVPAGSTDVCCRVVTGDSNDSVNSAVALSAPTVNGTTYTWTVNGGTATSGSTVNYMFSYTHNGVDYVQYAASHVETVPLHKAAWVASNRNSAGNNGSYSQMVWLNFGNIFGIDGAMPVGGVIAGSMQNIGSGNARGVTSPSYNSDDGLIATDEYTIGNILDMSGANRSDWGANSNGYTNDYVGADVYFDKTKVAQINTAIPASTTMFCLRGQANGILEFVDDQMYVSTNTADSAQANPEINWNNKSASNFGGLTLASGSRYPTAADYNQGRRGTYPYTYNLNLPLNGSGKFLRIGHVYKSEDWVKKGTFSSTSCYIVHYFGFYLNFNAVDRSAAHDSVNLAIGKNFAKAMMKAQWWDSYRQAVLGVYKYVGDLRSTDNSSVAQLNALLNNPSFATANYSVLLNAVNSATNAQLSSSNTCISNYNTLRIKVNENDDPRYAGYYYDGSMFENGASELIDVIAGRTSVYSVGASEAQNNLSSFMLDFRYQTAIDAYAQLISDTAAQQRLAAADYSAVEAYADTYNAADSTVFFNTALGAGKNNSAADREYANGKPWHENVFTNSSVTAFENAVAFDRTLKKPSETAAIVQKNDSTKTMPRISPANDSTVCIYNTVKNAYEGLELRRAAEYYSPTGSATLDSKTYYAAYNKSLNGTYVYTADLTGGNNADVTRGGYAVVKAAVDMVYNNGANPSYAVYDGEGNIVGSVKKYTASTWATFADTYADVFNGSAYNPSDYTLAIYIQRDIMPALAAIEQSMDSLAENSANLTTLVSQASIKAGYENGGTEYSTNLAQLSHLTTSGDVDGGKWYTDSTWAAYTGAKASAQAIINAGTAAAGEQSMINALAVQINNARQNLVPKKLSDYASSVAMGGAYSFAQRNAVVEQWNSEMNSAVSSNPLIYKYSDASRSEWQTAYARYLAASAHADGDLALWAYEYDAVCGEIEQAYAGRAAHTLETIPGRAATCTESGLTEGKRCTSCGEVFVQQEVIPALGHDWSEWAVTAEPQLDTDGVRERTCRNCGEKQTEVIDRLAWSIDLDAAGGVSESRVFVLKGSAVGTLPVAEKEGYVLGGWYTSNEEKLSEETVITSDISVTAKWLPKVTISAVSANIVAGSTIQLSAQVTPDADFDTTVIWTSSNPNIASVDGNGAVTAKAYGNVLITATYGDGSVKASCVVRVQPVVSTVVISSNSGDLIQKVSWWKSYSSAKMSLRFGTYNCSDAVRYEWSSSNDKVMVDQNGNITNKGSGSRSARITVKGYDANGRLVASGSVVVGFYKFNRERDRLSIAPLDSGNYQMEVDSAPVNTLFARLLAILEKMLFI